MSNKRFPESWEDAVNFLPNGSKASYKYDENYATIYEEAASNMAQRYESEIASLQKRIEELEADKERLNWIEKIMTPKETYCEVYFAGLRNGYADATEFQIESNPWEHFQSIRGKSVRDVIDKAKQLLK